MRSVLIIPGFPAGYLVLPSLVGMLQEAGMDVCVGGREAQAAMGEYVRAATGREAVLEEDCGGYDAVLCFDEACVPEYARRADCPVVVPLRRSVFKVGGGLGTFEAASAEACFEAVMSALTPQDYRGRTLLITCGPTIEDADPARYISNRSTGRMGTAIARMAARRGGRVLLVHGPMQSAIPDMDGIVAVPVRSARQMCDAVMERLSEADIAILCAAVADFAPCQYSEEKIKKGKSQLFTLQMQRTPDILAAVGASPNKPAMLVGFAAESNNVKDNALDKLIRKNCDMLCANDITAPGCGFAVDTNRLLVFTRDGQQREIPLASKDKVANELLNLCLA